MRTALLLCLSVYLTAAEISPPAPIYQDVTISNASTRVVLTTNRGNMSQFNLVGHQPIRLPRHLLRQIDPPPSASDLAVLRFFFQGGAGSHDWFAADNIPGGIAQDDAPWSIIRQAPNEVVFVREIPQVVRYEMAYAMNPDRPTVQVRLSISNLAATEVSIEPWVMPLNGLHQDYGPGEQIYLSAFAHHGGSAGKISAESLPGFGEDINGNGRLDPGEDLNGNRRLDVDPLKLADSTQGVDYIGLKSRFFAAWWTPQTEILPSTPVLTVEKEAAGPLPPTAALPLQPLNTNGWRAQVQSFIGRSQEQQANIWIVYDRTQLKPGETWSRGWTLSASSMTKKDLAKFSEIEKRIEFTDGFYRFFKILAKGLTWVLDLIYSMVRHYGVAVILLTILIKGALYRTTFKQQESMLKMQKIGPELKYVQEQYKNNKQMLAQKQMELFKKHGVNPLGGCLPILIQLPIFIALFQAFSHSADLRGTSFLWIPDLTLPDQVWGTPVSWLGNWIFSINPLPIIYIGVSAWMSFSQKPPANSDPQQEMMYKMMRWMPVVFGFIFYNMPSGLVLYFTVQAVISTLEIKYIKRKLGMG